MKICGLQKLTLLDYPEKTACTVFTAGCNFRCPFCHNASLVLSGRKAEEIPLSKVFEFLEKRKNVLEGVCVSGGEPLVQPGLEMFLFKVKEMGYSVKLDTNGAFPGRLENLINKKLVDYVAMDIKNSREKYDESAGAAGTLIDVEKSVKLLMRGDIPYEFRTTAVKGLHDPSDFDDIGRWLEGAKRYYIQCFRDSGDTIVKGLKAPSKEELESFLRAVKAYITGAEIRNS